ncbi:MAG: Winged helix-turn helix [Verrucomicrobiota bacterium]
MLCGGSVELTLAHAGVSIRCLQLWIRRFNQSGIDGITYRPKSGRPRLMESAEISEKSFPSWMIRNWQIGTIGLLSPSVGGSKTTRNW